jgi:hypothetical protein
MIVRANEELEMAAKGLRPSPKDLLVPLVPSTWDGHELTKHQTREGNDNASLLDSLAEMIPEWMSNSLMAGNVLVMDAEDFYELDEEVRKRLEVLRR